MVPSVRLLLDFASHLLGILEPSVAIFLQIGRPIESGEVSMYVYRITACDLSHLSHTRLTVNFVVLFRRQPGWRGSGRRNGSSKRITVRPSLE
ncbi:hypothetical protein DVH24_035587 [Malus domestica]|uniref:Uncharacterized protein n=1 Tax=Malus domestica TaxID=3750 RepID=A0A498JLU6_MALDO|nr:hypothetical protein DVH24_035587 [Malus domestica]